MASKMLKTHFLDYSWKFAKNLFFDFFRLFSTPRGQKWPLKCSKLIFFTIPGNLPKIDFLIFFDFSEVRNYRHTIFFKKIIMYQMGSDGTDPVGPEN